MGWVGGVSLFDWLGGMLVVVQRIRSSGVKLISVYVIIIIGCFILIYYSSPQLPSSVYYSLFNVFIAC